LLPWLIPPDIGMRLLRKYTGDRAARGPLGNGACHGATMAGAVDGADPGGEEKWKRASGRI
jgi:hypothetical protein